MDHGLSQGISVSKKRFVIERNLQKELQAFEVWDELASKSLFYIETDASNID